MSAPRFRPDGRALCLAAALLLAAAAVAAPRIAVRVPAYDLLATVDITGSMNVRDYARDGRPASRLDTVKGVLRDLAATLPCGSRLGLAVFSERRSFLLFEPMEVCGNFAPLDGAIAALDWRMAWEGDSYVAAGLYSAIALAAQLKADLLFFSDGQEAPPLPASGTPPFSGEAGAVRGLIVGVGGTTPGPIPKFDRDGREIGFYSMADVPQENRFGIAPAGSETREGWHPRNAPWGAGEAVGDEHLSAVRASHLHELARGTGLAYGALGSVETILPALDAQARPRTVPGAMDMAPVPAGLALALLAALYTLPLFRSHPSAIRSHEMRSTRP